MKIQGSNKDREMLNKIEFREGEQPLQSEGPVNKTHSCLSLESVNRHNKVMWAM
jgi:hypothetical protein